MKKPLKVKFNLPDNDQKFNMLGYCGHLVSKINGINKILDENEEIKAYEIHYNGNISKKGILLKNESVGDAVISIDDWICIFYQAGCGNTIFIYPNDSFNLAEVLQANHDHLTQFIHKENTIQEHMKNIHASLLYTPEMIDNSIEEPSDDFNKAIIQKYLENKNKQVSIDE